MADAAKAVEVSGEENYVSKLTTKVLGCKPDMVKTLPDGQNKLAIARLYGKALAVKIQINKDVPGEDWTYFAGTFEGINLQDGTVLRSGKLFLPKGVSEVVEQEINRATKTDPNAEVAFAFEIRAVKATNKAGYSYEAAALKSPAAEDALAEMRKTIAALPTHEQKLKLADGGNKGKPALEGQVAKRA